MFIFGIIFNYIFFFSIIVFRYGFGVYCSGVLSGSSYSNGFSEFWFNSVSSI